MADSNGIPAAAARRSGRPAEDLARQLYEQQGEGREPWRELSARERAAWLERAEQSLHALAELGYRVESPAGLDQVQSAASRSLVAVREAEQLLRMGEPLLAYNAVQQALEDGHDGFRLHQLKGLALARSGDVARANSELAALRAAGHNDGETLGLLARTHKDLALAAAAGALRERHLAAAFEIYDSGYRASRRAGATADAYYTGINAATIALLRGDQERACAIAAEVETLCEQALADSAGDETAAYWPQATLAEAALVRGDETGARDRYAAAARLAGHRYGDLSSTRRQARLLLRHQGRDSGWLDEALRIPPVLVYTGHMIDAPGRAAPRFPPELEGAVRAWICEQLDELRPVGAYGSAACGTDILCLECVRELGGELHIVLPFPVEHFRAESVDLRPGGNWGERFERLLESADEVLVIGDQPPPRGESTFEYANLVMTGLARLRAQMLETGVQGLAVWDGAGAGGAGGTGSVVDLWEKNGVPLIHIAPDTSAPADSATVQATPANPPAGGGGSGDGFAYTIKTMLFADAVGYSRLTDEQIPLFFEHYLGAVGDLNERTASRAEHIETAGDGLYLVFDDPAAAGHYALDLSELINGRDWPGLGLPADLSIRIGLHCGPVFVGRDPVTGRPLYTGSHTSRTARIEPITPPGQVYASSAYAAIAAATGVEGLRFSYIGRTQLAKQYGKLALYHVTRAAADRRA
jgi:hypothetical protein